MKDHRFGFGSWISEAYIGETRAGRRDEESVFALNQKPGENDS